MKYVLFIFFIILSSCSPNIQKGYKKLSKPEKTWVLFHPLKAKKAFLISKETTLLKDSISNFGNIGKDNNGGQLDAFKHSFWMARLSQNIGKRAALKLGKAHEKGNYQTYIKQQLEDGYLPDKPSTKMDLFNNSIGATLGERFPLFSKKSTIQKLLKALQNGDLRILSKNALGNFLDCNKKIIPIDSLEHRWNNKKCLVKSNE